MGLETKRIHVICDTDLHGMSCGLVTYSVLREEGYNVTVYSHFEPQAPKQPVTNPQGLAQYLEMLGEISLVIMDIPVDSRNPKRYIDAIISHNRYKGRVIWADHHGHSQWVQELVKEGVTVYLLPSSFELSMLFARLYNKQDSWFEKWALIGALADFDASIKDKVPRELEEDVCEYLDPYYKFHREEFIQEEGYYNAIPEHGNVGALIMCIAHKRIEPEELIEKAKQRVQGIQVPTYNVIGHVVYTTQLPQQGLAWKTAWKLCMLTDTKVAMVPSFNPFRNEYAVIVASNWRYKEEVADIIEEFVQRRFSGRMIVGHKGARSIVLMSQNEIYNIPQWARELNELIESKLYIPKSTTFISDKYIGQAIARDFRTILQRLTELLEQQRRMYQEYLELKRKQVELLERMRERGEEAD